MKTAGFATAKPCIGSMISAGVNMLLMHSTPQHAAFSMAELMHRSLLSWYVGAGRVPKFFGNAQF